MRVKLSHITARIPAAQLRRIDDLARRHGVSRTAAISWALDVGIAYAAHHRAQTAEKPAKVSK